MLWRYSMFNVTGVRMVNTTAWILLKYLYLCSQDTCPAKHKGIWKYGETLILTCNRAKVDYLRELQGVSEVHVTSPSFVGVTVTRCWRQGPDGQPPAKMYAGSTLFHLAPSWKRKIRKALGCPQCMPLTLPTKRFYDSFFNVIGDPFTWSAITILHDCQLNCPNR